MRFNMSFVEKKKVESVVYRSRGKKNMNGVGNSNLIAEMVTGSRMTLHKGRILPDLRHKSNAGLLF